MDKEAFKKQLNEKIDQIDEKIKELQSHAEKIQADSKEEYHRQLEELHHKRQELEDKLHEINEAKGPAWEDLKSGAEMAWQSLSESVKSAIERFKKK